ncbi:MULTISPECIES: diacylglycerol kinase [Alphaproteobacteria]|uniref:Diacylglycerol kinase n=2 Tax=Alphaproteobacteria TaxID=28211 RepID=A0A512HCA6_9HYPH|nr:MULTISPECIES: diacylglycerol kinase [Alphaproteobacteria]GEO83088.1 diacylglycerol kinase [Ciceribacter naphthalenivorans]GLR20517.1 diacylglycerol kinase [Ciceribacter naphthalenivorans]GLT03373.1 diacylglycerol kinase [Sphingomonas psychrolutea]
MAEGARDKAADEQAAATIKKNTGVAHFFAAARYSFQGFRRLIGESAFRHELLALALGLALFALVGASLAEYVGFLVLMLVLFCIEAINTAIEELVDRISPEISTVGRNAKDLGSFSVFCLLVANGVYAGYVVFF